MHARLILSYTLFSGLLLSGFAAPAVNWTDTGATFSAGHLGNSGQNLYVNRHGELETIRRYDLDGNGHLDLVFNSSHDLYSAIPATLATAEHQALKTTAFQINGSSRVVAVDLNQDGFTDLVFMPNPQNLQEDRSSLIVAWGNAMGWSTNRLTRQLPVNGITDLAVGDLNHDGWPDLITLNSTGWLYGQPEGKIVRVYWGSANGYLLTNYQDLGVVGAVKLATGNFGPDRTMGAVVLIGTGKLQFLRYDAKSRKLTPATVLDLPLNSTAELTVKAQALTVQPQGKDRSDRLWVSTNTSTLLQVETAEAQPSVKVLHAGPATQLALGRLDDDEWPDLVLTNRKLVFPTAQPAVAAAPFPSTTILWGTREGVDTAHPLALSIPNACAAAIGDLDRDGHGDLAVAVYQGAQSLVADSRIFFGNGSRQLPTVGQPVATEGAEGVAVARVAPQSAPTAIFANSLHRTLDDAVPLRVYWGVAGGFSRDAFVDIPNLSGYKSSAADLNGDGYVDLIVVNGGDATSDTLSRAPDAGVKIYWGGPAGNLSGPGPTKFDTARYTVLHESHIGSINVADLNHDGYLDIVLGAFESAEHPDTQLVIYYGGPDGFSRDRRKTVPVPGRSIGCLIADFNRDGDLDIVIGSYKTDQVITYWGRGGEYSDSRKSVLPYPAPIDLEAADLNGDGWLDLIVSSYQDAVAHHHDTGMSIFWGGQAGWHQSRSQWLPGMTTVGLAVGDLDGDGYLDLVAPHYHGELSREQLPSYIFWGSPTGFEELKRTSLIVNSASEVVIADFNGDGKPDLAFCAHSVDAGHLLESPVFFNDGHRFAAPAVQYLPAVGPHYMWVQDIGNIYTRHNEENFTSRILTWNDTFHGGRLTLDATSPFGAKVRVQVRSAPNTAALDSAPWRELPEAIFTLAEGDRALQYRLDLLSANGDAYPKVRKVEISIGR